MNLSVRKADSFILDFEEQFAWYSLHASWDVAWRYLVALDATLEQLAFHPKLGRVRRFRHPKLRGSHSYRVHPPFDKHLIFYRFTSTTLFVERVLHGARDLARRLRELPGGEANVEE